MPSVFERRMAQSTDSAVARIAICLASVPCIVRVVEAQPRSLSAHGWFRLLGDPLSTKVRDLPIEPGGPASQTHPIPVVGAVTIVLVVMKRGPRFDVNDCAEATSQVAGKVRLRQEYRLNFKSYG